MIDITIKNFQSIRDAHFQIDGFTTLVGRNALGKSAVLRAINAALTNQQGTDFITWGEKFCEIHIVMEGLDLLWHKEEGNNFYVVNNERYEKIGREVPPTPIADAGFRLIKLGTEKINLNYAKQFVPLFLVDRQDSKGADLLTSVYGLDRLYKAVDLCNKSQGQNRDLLKLREKDRSSAERDLEKFDGFEDVKDSVGMLEQKKKKVDVLESEIAKVRGWGVKSKELLLACRKLEAGQTVVLPRADKITELIRALQKIKVYSNSVQKYKNEISSLEDGLSVDIPVNGKNKIEILLKELTVITRWNKMATSLALSSKQLKEACATNLPEVPDGLENLTKLKNLSRRLETEKLSALTTKKKHEEIVTEIEKIKEQLNAYDTCPLCGHELKGQHGHA